MTPKLETVEYVGGYTLHLKFSDGAEGDLDLQDELWGEVFEPLQDLDFFQRFHVDRELNAITWPSGADLAPEFLYEQVAGRAGRVGPSGRS
ncbi:MAG: DUF2442 domain-containing protein [Candidatus Hydrogenedentota bacterium]